MSGMERAFVTLGVDAGGKDANQATSLHYMHLRKLLDRECRGPYGEAVSELALVLRIDGSIQAWNKHGAGNIRLQKKSGYVTADVFVPEAAWKDADVVTIRTCLANGVRDAVQQVITRLEAAKMSMEVLTLSKDVERALSLFLVGAA